MSASRVRVLLARAYVRGSESTSDKRMPFEEAYKYADYDLAKETVKK